MRRTSGTSSCLSAPSVSRSTRNSCSRLSRLTTHPPHQGVSMPSDIRPNALFQLLTEALAAVPPKHTTLRSRIGSALEAFESVRSTAHTEAFGSGAPDDDYRAGQ